MTSSKQKGTAAETAVCNYLKAHWPHVERRAMNGSKDRGDIAGIPGAVIEVKNCKATNLAGWTGELSVEMVNDGAKVGAVIHKKRGTTDVGQWYATMPVAVLVELLREWTA